MDSYYDFDMFNTSRFWNFTSVDESLFKDYDPYSSITYTEGETPADDYSEYNKALIAASCIGIVTHLALVLVVIAGFVMDKASRFWARNWLLINLSVVHVIYLVCTAIHAHVTLSGGHLPPMCILSLHLDRSAGLWSSLGITALTLHVFCQVFFPRTVQGKLQLVVWAAVILATWVAAHLIGYYLFTVFTEKVSIFVDGQNVSTCMTNTSDKPYLVLIIPFILPNGFSLLLALLSTYRFGFGEQKEGRREATDTKIESWKTSSIVFILVVLLIQWLARFPGQAEFLLPMAGMENLIGKGMVHVGLFLYVLEICAVACFPFICIILGEVRGVLSTAKVFMYRRSTASEEGP